MENICHSFAEQIRARLGNFSPDIALILGSGLGSLADQIASPIIIPYSEINGFPQSTVSGHKGQFIAGMLNDKKVLCMQGRIHLYEGHAPQNISQIIKSFKLLGITTLIVTNAAGSMRTSLPAGSLMLITDHINLSSHHPLIGANDETFGPRFPDMSNAYDNDLQSLAKQVANEQNIKLHEGVYLMVSGPSFETKAEVKAFGFLGADAVGMSTVPEVISAVHVGIKVLGFSVITNLGTGLQVQTQSHAETLAQADSAAGNLAQLINNVIERI